MKFSELLVDFTWGCPGLQAQLAKQGVFSTPESADALAVAEGDRLAISRLFARGYFSEAAARGLLVSVIQFLFTYPLKINGVVVKGGGSHG